MLSNVLTLFTFLISGGGREEGGSYNLLIVCMIGNLEAFHSSENFWAGPGSTIFFSNTAKGGIKICLTT